ncbi:hypothetical protein C7957_10757 [Halanaerobium saccharolyticum]|uniref:Uncharacterized protein n=1 Tax=Halanaerobium saccharolyticum TaxID=43595 RepID=A0A4R6SA86_9FIRM|nr:hypothetical protein [Halanaerobium saccharolyticum]TDP96862.1 hypothetical protein C7957_10757 [Halanaerobium saccharolyticum]
MKKFLKKASIYLLLMLLIAAAVFSLNYFLGRKLAGDLENDLKEIAAENDYQLRYLNINSNPLLRRVEVNTLSFRNNSEQSFEVNGAEIEFSWQQIFNYLKDGKFLAKKDITAEIDKFSFYDLQQNNHFDFYNSSLSYQGEINSQSVKEPLQLIKNNHRLSIASEEVIYDYPYYRSYGITKANWERISTFRDFAFNADYQSENKKLTVNDFALKNEFIDYQLDFETVLEEKSEAEVEAAETSKTASEPEEMAAEKETALAEIVLYSRQNQKLLLKELQSNYQLALNGELLNLSENDLFNQFSFAELNLDSDFAMYLNSEKKNYQIQKFDLNFDLSDFQLVLKENLSQEVNQSSFGILAQNDEFELNIESLNYLQQFNHPKGKIELDLISNLIDARLNAEFNYSEEMPYISSSQLKFKAKKQSVEQLLLFAQLLNGDNFEQDKEGYYQLEIWGRLDNLNFE